MLLEEEAEEEAGLVARASGSRALLLTLWGQVLVFAAFSVGAHWTLDQQLEAAFLQEFTRGFGREPLREKEVVITGANSGVGFHAAKWMSEWGGAKVIHMGCRDLRKCEDAAHLFEKGTQRINN